MKKIIIFFAIVFIVAVSGLLYFNQQTKAYDKNNSEAIHLEIPKGSSFTKASEILYQNKLIKSKIVFKIFAKQNNMTKVKAGSYKLNQAMDNKEILTALNEGDVFLETNKVLIPEGYKLLEIAEKLDQQNIVSKEEFLTLANDVNRYRSEYRFLEDDKINSLEGYLFPDTYTFNIGISSDEIIRIMLDRFDELFIDEYYQRAKDVNRSIHQIVTMASVIEKEAKKGNERPIVAGVFYNRLKIGQKLESCATIQYLFDKVKPKLSYKDLEIDSPYNTYKNQGLPPGPIASAGIESIKASLYPEDVEYFYFFANEDGTHTFSKTYKEHLNAQNKK